MKSSPGFIRISRQGNRWEKGGQPRRQAFGSGVLVARGLRDPVAVGFGVLVGLGVFVGFSVPGTVGTGDQDDKAEAAASLAKAYAETVAWG